MSLIDTSYFLGELVLVTGYDLALTADLNNQIAVYEPEYLQKVLGASLYEVFTSGIDETTGGDFDPVDFDPVDFNTGAVADRWLWLRDGHTFLINGRRYIWPGFTNARKQSGIANYVYYWYRRARATITTGVGEAQPNAENSTRTPATMKMARAWNRMVELNQILHYILYGALDANGGRLYSEFNARELDRNLIEQVNIFNI